MNIDQYSDRAKQAVQSAQSLALARRHQQFAPEHLLKVLLEEKDGLSRALIQSAGGRPDAVDQAVDALLGRRPRVEGGSGQIYLAPESASVFAAAEAGAKAAGDDRATVSPAVATHRIHLAASFFLRCEALNWAAGRTARHARHAWHARGSSCAAVAPTIRTPPAMRPPAPR